MRSAHLLVLLAVVTGCGVAPPPTPSGGRVVTTLPEPIDAEASYVFYLHGRIVEEEGRAAEHPRFGRYEYDAILAALAAPGNVVVSEVRAAGTDMDAYAEVVASQVRALLAAGVPAARITVVGASKGAGIAMRASTLVETPGVGYVVLGGCGAGVVEVLDLALHGDVLSIYEASDEIGQSCEHVLSVSPDVGAQAELRLDTGLAHGFLYRPLPQWVDPALAWAARRALGEG